MWEDIAFDEDSPSDSPDHRQPSGSERRQRSGDPDTDPDDEGDDEDEQLMEEEDEDEEMDEEEDADEDYEMGADRTVEDDEADALYDDGWDPFSFNARSASGSLAAQPDAGASEGTDVGEYERLAAKKRQALKQRADASATRRAARAPLDDNDEEEEDEEEDEDEGDEGEGRSSDADEGEEGRPADDSYFGFSVDDIAAMAKSLGLAGAKDRRRRGQRGQRNPRKTWSTKGGMTDEVYKLLGDASLHYAMGRYHEAVDKLRSAIQLSPQVAESYELMGLCYEALGNAAKALDLFMLDAHLRRKDIAQWRHLASLSWQQGNVRQTVYCLDRVIRRDLADEGARRQRALLLASLGAHDKALGGFEALLQMRPTDNEVALMVAQEARASFQLARGARTLQSMVSAHPETTDFATYSSLVELYSDLGKHQAALDVLVLAQATHATRPPPREAFPLELVASTGICHLHLGQLQHAQNKFSVLQRAGVKKCPQLFMRVADKYHQLGYPREALEFYKPMCMGTPTHLIETELCLKLGRAHLDAGEGEQARQCFVAVLDRQPDHVQARLALSDYHLQQEDAAAALAVLEADPALQGAGGGGGAGGQRRDEEPPAPIAPTAPTPSALLPLAVTKQACSDHEELPHDGTGPAGEAHHAPGESDSNAVCPSALAAACSPAGARPGTSSPAPGGATGVGSDASTSAVDRQSLFYRRASLLHRMGMWEEYLRLVVPQVQAAFAGTADCMVGTFLPFLHACIHGSCVHGRGGCLAPTPTNNAQHGGSHMLCSVAMATPACPDPPSCPDSYARTYVEHCTVWVWTERRFAWARESKPRRGPTCHLLRPTPVRLFVSRGSTCCEHVCASSVATAFGWL
eukprot:jgi/Mesvir1/17805/Mv25071-RA.1